MFSYKHWLTWCGLCQDEIDIVKKAKKDTHKHSAVKLLRVSFRFWCLKQHRAARSLHQQGGKKELEKSTGRVVAPKPETGRYPGRIHRPNHDTLPVVSSHTATQPCANHHKPDLVWRYIWGISVTLLFFHYPKNDLICVSNPWFDPNHVFGEPLHSYATLSFTGSHYVPIRSSWVMCDT